MKTYSLLAACGLLLAACSQRNPTYGNHDGAPQPDGLTRADTFVGHDTHRARDGGPPPPPTDLGPMPCSDSAECGAGSYCLFGPDCGKSAPGICTPQPTGGCPEYYSPVCGCDGKTYGNKCEAATAGASVAHAGECNKKKTCNDLNNAYVAAVQAAKACAPMLPVVQCELLVDSALHCGCPTYVEKGNTNAINTLKQAQQDFKALGCVPYQCGMPCPGAQPGNCGVDFNGAGSCK